jgi:hypothetical protein
MGDFVEDESKQTITRISKSPKKVKMPEHVKIAWEDLEPSIASVFRASKWSTKYKMLQIFKDWIDGLK